MSKELKKFIFIFSHMIFFLVIVVAMIALFVTEHWVIGLCILIPGFAGTIAYMESDLCDLLAKKFYKGGA